MPHFFQRLYQTFRCDENENTTLAVHLCRFILHILNLLRSAVTLHAIVKQTAFFNCGPYQLIDGSSATESSHTNLQEFSHFGTGVLQRGPEEDRRAYRK